jgi:hypothetical protein
LLRRWNLVALKIRILLPSTAGRGSLSQRLAGATQVLDCQSSIAMAGGGKNKPHLDVCAAAW